MAAGSDPLVPRRRPPPGRWLVWVLAGVGGYLLCAPWLAPELSGWRWFTRAFGGEEVVLRFAVGALFLYVAALTHERYRLKFLLEDVLEACRMLLFGRDYRRHREVVAAQIEHLRAADPRRREAAHRALRQLTGQDLPPDYEVWRAWWRVAAPTFTLPSARTGRPES